MILLESGALPALRPDVTGKGEAVRVKGGQGACLELRPQGSPSGEGIHIKGTLQCKGTAPSGTIAATFKSKKHEQCTFAAVCLDFCRGYDCLEVLTIRKQEPHEKDVTVQL